MASKIVDSIYSWTNKHFGFHVACKVDSLIHALTGFTAWSSTERN